MTSYIPGMEEREIECPIPDNYDIDDSKPPEEKYKAGYEVKISTEPLIGAINFFRTSFLPCYSRADDQALKFQKQHKTIARIAISLGFLAILFAILQLCRLSLSSEMTIPFVDLDVVEIFRVGEVIAGIFAAVAVVAGLYRASQNKWLINRHIAERYRLLKFRSLLDKKFWDINTLGEWQHETKEKIRELNRLYERENNGHSFQNAAMVLYTKIRSAIRREKEEPDVIEDWINTDEIAPRRESGNCSYSSAAKAEFLDYYRKKRLVYQRNYYFCRHRDLKITHERTKKLPKILFTVSVVAVLLHFVIDLCFKDTFGHITSIVLIGVAVAVPIGGYVVKTYRDTFQVAKSSALYYAKYSALNTLNKQLAEYEDSIDENWPGILDILWECENFLEAEHREWLILIQDAEWFL